ncbi:hypothetical protein [uncultured Mucilaginibacter sp.]|uniref:hypothetical protein n=1 Tax=uncultured Mucilaginibacter sp. TaxID=797541 RepID=UPI0025E6CBD6|nr:hypothetical protein [uncultured Mucilaginibacter sp.]
MNKILLLIFLSFVVLGCSKAKEDEPEVIANKSFKLNIKVDDNAGSFTAIQNVNLGKNVLATGNTLASNVTNIYYRIYNAEGKLLSSVKQTSTTADFGTVSQELPVGEYKVFIAASKGEILLIDNNDLSKDRFGFPNGWEDTFTSLTTISIKNADVSQTIKLERALGMLSLTITDAIPFNIARISISMQPENIYKYIGGGQEIIPTGMSYNTNVSYSDIGVRNKNFSTLIGNTGAAININVKAYNSVNVVIVEKNIPNITFSKNKKTEISLQLFTP